jgi:hypothetical protein
MSDTSHSDYVGAMFVYLKSSLLYDTNNAALIEACDRLVEISNTIWNRTRGQAEMRSRYDGVYVNQTRLVDPDRSGQIEYVQGIWNALDIAAIAPRRPTTRNDWLEFSQVLTAFARAESDLKALADATLPALAIAPPQRTDDRPGQKDPRPERMRSYFLCVAAMRDAWDQGKQLVAVKRPLCDLLACVREFRGDLLGMIAAPAMPHDHAYHLVNTALLCGSMATELELDRQRTLELAMAGLLHGCDASIAKTIGRQVGLRQGQHRNAFRMTVANEWRLPMLGEYELGMAGRLDAVAHEFEKRVAPPIRESPEQVVDGLFRNRNRYDAGAVSLLGRAISL